jgi:hypothetical protein
MKKTKRVPRKPRTVRMAEIYDLVERLTTASRQAKLPCELRDDLRFASALIIALRRDGGIKGWPIDLYGPRPFDFRGRRYHG